MFYVYKADEVRDRNGDRLPFQIDARLTSYAYGGVGLDFLGGGLTTGVKVPTP